MRSREILAVLYSADKEIWHSDQTMNVQTTSDLSSSLARNGVSIINILNKIVKRDFTAFAEAFAKFRR